MSGIRKRRFWSDEEKRSICAQRGGPGVSVAQVAQRYSMNSNLIFKWLRDNRIVPEEDAAQPDDGIMAFLPVEFGDPSFAECAQSVENMPYVQYRYHTGDTTDEVFRVYDQIRQRSPAQADAADLPGSSFSTWDFAQFKPLVNWSKQIYIKHQEIQHDTGIKN